MSKWTVGAVALAVGALFMTHAIAGGTNKTGQGIMVNLKSAGHIVIIENQQWDFDATVAAGYFTNVWDGQAPTCSASKNTTCAGATVPSAPAPDPTRVTANGSGAVSNNQCTFLVGGQLTGSAYTQTVTQQVGSKPADKLTWTFNYNVTGGTVASRTAWIMQPLGTPGLADVIFGADIAGESVLVSGKYPAPGKFSFSLTDSAGTSRVSSLALTVKDASGNTVFSGSPTSTVNYPVEFNYKTNAGMNGTTSLLADGDDFTLLNGDVFKGNDNGGADGSAAALASMDPVHVGLGAGSYFVDFTGIVKDNSGSLANVPFDVTKSVHIEAGQCTNMAN